ncbi:MAG: 16S rRNA (cytosine(1402)-N(4))-methyltransferase RsmH [bacterium]|nr:MAG: 16S rRNA (cytosine(1402)-N(4))-methyltransferase RsmH [bacterium]
MGSTQHTPVMVESVTKFLAPKPGGRYLDVTMGGGGHAEHLLKAVGGDITVVGIDRDPAALEVARHRLAAFGSRVSLAVGNFRHVKRIVPDGDFDGIFADLGLSSLQLADTGRGFSYLRDGPLDMSMGPNGRSVATLLQRGDEGEISGILKQFGQVRRHRTLTRAILTARTAGQLGGTMELRAAVERVLPVHGRMQILSKVFQAFRIWANEELECLRDFLPQAVLLLSTGGRLVVISYHSLEDGIVKGYFRREERDCICPPDFPQCRCGHAATLAVMTRRPVRPSPEEVAVNPRSRSARLRAAEKRQ